MVRGSRSSRSCPSSLGRNSLLLNCTCTCISTFDWLYVSTIMRSTVIDTLPRSVMTVMVHRPADSRLLTNLLNAEKEYSKHLDALLDASHVSLTSLSAYAASSPPPVSHIILAVAASQASADDALRRYALAINEWRDHLSALKDLEDEVGIIMRDREIL
jgi:hypothetical protein